MVVALPEREDQPFQMTSSHHVSCFKLPRKLATGANKITIEEFVDDYLVDGTEEGTILPEHKDEILQQLHQAAAAAKSGKKKKGDADEERSALMARLKAAAKEDEEGAGKEPAKKKAKKEGTDTGVDEKLFQEMLAICKSSVCKGSPQECE